MTTAAVVYHMQGWEVSFLSLMAIGEFIQMTSQVLIAILGG